MLVDAHVHIGKSTRLQIDADGALLLALPNGSTRAITAGEVFFVAP